MTSMFVASVAVPVLVLGVGLLGVASEFGTRPVLK